MRPLYLIFSLYLTWPLASLASDAASLDFLGFSLDGKYLAFEQFGIADGVGEAYAELHLIDVVNNAYAVSPFKQSPSGETVASEPAESEEQAIALVREANSKAAQTEFEKLNLQTLHKGNQVIAHPLTDLSANPLQVRFTPHLPLAGHAYDEFILHLQEIELEKECYGLGKAKIFNLKVRTKDQTLAQAATLQVDQRLPKSRGCPLGYRIAHVYVYQEKYLAVFLNMFLPGFEGHDMRYLVVTGVLPESTKGHEKMSDEAQQKRESIFQQAVDKLEQKKAKDPQNNVEITTPKANTLMPQDNLND